jgi:hypothetical protein
LAGAFSEIGQLSVRLVIDEAGSSEKVKIVFELGEGPSGYRQELKELLL